MTTSQLLARLRRHYIKPGASLPGGIFLPEVGWNGQATGHGCRADALYVGFTSASGRILIGHELKVSRADWLRELDQPGKGDPWHDECHAWFVVAPSTDVVVPTEVPPGWGLMVSTPRTTTRLRVEIKPRIRETHQPSWLAVRSIMARQDTLRAQEVDEIRRTAHDEAREALAGEYKRIAEGRARREQHEAAETLREIETTLGCSFLDWSSQNFVTPEQFAAALSIVKTKHALLREWRSAPHAIATLDELRAQVMQLVDALAVLDRPSMTERVSHAS